MPKKDETQLPIPTEEQSAQLQSLAHRVQSAIAFFEGRVEAGLQDRFQGVNSAMVETSALARLMFRKNLITADEYFDTLIECWEEEVNSYRLLVKEVDGRLDI